MTWLMSLSVASIVSAVLMASNPPASYAASLQPPLSCSVTIPSFPLFVAPAPYPQNAPSRNFWFGSEKLWTMLVEDGTWHALPRNPNGFRQKIFWWSPGFDGRVEPRPQLSVIGRRLDGPEAFVNPTPATNAHHADFGGWTILTGIDVPTAGCWELTGTYHNQSVTFVVWIPGTNTAPR
jgi:hypothetical protein